MRILSSLSFCALSSLTCGAIAEETKPLSLDVELGIIATSGNTETSSVKTKFNIKQDFKKFKTHYIAEALYKEDQIEFELEGETQKEKRKSAERYFLSGQIDFKLDSEHKGLFGFASYEDDRFSGYEYQGTLALGFSNRLFDYDQSHLDYSVGPGIAFSKTEDVFDADDNLIAGESTQTAVVRASIDYLYNISETAKFTQTISSDIAAEQTKNTKTKSETAVTANLSSAFALKAAFVVNHNTHAPLGKRHADTQTSLTVVYSY
ncbi:MAG: putative salt-induced outer membrane protein [Flavobacteriales bacterium]|jgi:putative salt-induced outer membrane protein